MILKDVIKILEAWAPLSLQESYDNAGLITGSPKQRVSKALVCLDATPMVVDEAIKSGCELIIAHHPIVFSGLKKITGKTYVERTIIKAIKNDIAIYAIHTNLDNVIDGVNSMIAKKIGLVNCRILSSHSGSLKKLYTFCPAEKVDKVSKALFEAGAGNVGNYSHASFNTLGIGTFKGNDKSNPKIGQKGRVEEVAELRIEVLFPKHLESKILKALLKTHPYEEVAYDIVSLDNHNQEIGTGLIGELPKSISSEDFLFQLKKKMNCQVIRHTDLTKDKVQRIAVCGGSGSHVLKDAIHEGADVFVSADFKYHQFFDADGKIVIADIGHYESEQYTKQLISNYLSEKMPKFAVLLSKVNTNPIKYF